MYTRFYEERDPAAAAVYSCVASLSQRKETTTHHWPPHCCGATPRHAQSAPLPSVTHNTQMRRNKQRQIESLSHCSLVCCVSFWFSVQELHCICRPPSKFSYMSESNLAGSMSSRCLCYCSVFFKSIYMLFLFCCFLLLPVNTYNGPVRPSTFLLLLRPAANTSVVPPQPLDVQLKGLPDLVSHRLIRWSTAPATARIKHKQNKHSMNIEDHPLASVLKVRGV